MTLPTADPTRLLRRCLAVGGLLGVAVLTLIDRGATRALATPWIYLFWFAHIAPLLLLGLKALPFAPPLRVPGRPWLLLAAAFAASLTLSALFSPFRGPSLLAALTPFAGVAAFFLIYDRANAEDEPVSGVSMLRVIAWFSLLVVVMSVGRWSVAVVSSGSYRSVAALLAYRNDFPLGHSNYTAGIALLIIPWLGLAAWRARGVARAGWVFVTLLAIFMLFTSGSRGGFLGAAVLAVLAAVNARINRRLLALLGVLAITVVAALAYAHPRTRSMIFTWRSPSAEPNQSNVQRSAMALAGWRMGRDQPLLGWGPGTTPLVYPRYRAGLDGGVENALQLHSTPVQIWADLGIMGSACLVAFAVLIGRERRRLSLRGDARSATTPSLSSREATRRGDPADISDGLPRLPSEARNDNERSSEANEPGRHGGRPSISDAGSYAGSQPLATTAFVSLAGYTASALTDFQLDVPIFALGVSVCAALIAGPNPPEVGRTLRVSRARTRLGGDASPYLATASFGLGVGALLVLLLVGILGRRDPAPELNVRALTLANDPARASEAVSLFNASLGLNPDQEIAHFNLGWMLVVSDPTSAEKHFLAAAHLVPDKGGVYFGLALSRLNQTPREPAAIVRALALECLNDPQFLISPWWRQADIATFRDATIAELQRLADHVAGRLAAHKDPRSREAEYVATLARWLDGHGSIGEILRVSYTPARVTYFAARPPVPSWQTAKVKAYRRERPGYPVLMRNLDLPRPVDLFEVQENELTTGELAGLFPMKGWLPAPLLMELVKKQWVVSSE